MPVGIILRCPGFNTIILNPADPDVDFVGTLALGDSGLYWILNLSLTLYLGISL